VKSGSGNLVTACRDLLLFVLPNSSSNQPSNFALRILVGEMSPIPWLIHDSGRGKSSDQDAKKMMIRPMMDQLR
jgi:hypothetical protein